MMMSTAKSNILKTHQVNESFYAYMKDSHSFGFLLFFPPFQWSFWVVNAYLFLQTL